MFQLLSFVISIDPYFPPPVRSMDPRRLLRGHGNSNSKVRTVRFYGAKNGNAKLTARQVRQIRNLYTTGNETYWSLAEKFEVSRQTAYNVIERVIWRGVAV